MKKTTIASIALASLAATATAAAAASAQSPAASRSAERALQRRAVEAVNWGLPAVNYDLMLQQMLTKTSGKVNQIVYWSKPLDWHNQTGAGLFQRA